MKGSRRFRAERFLSRVDRRLLLRVVTIGTTAFVLGYGATALLFFRGNSRPRVVTVPDLRRSELNDARRRLGRAGLDLQVGDSLPHPAVPAGSILAQSPLPGAEAGPGSAIRVILSTGPERRAVPVVDSLPRIQAERVLEGAGFQVAIQEIPHASAPGSVVGVEPASGTLVPVPGNVRLLVSGGPPITAVPSLIGVHETEVPALLEAAGLELGQVRYEFGGVLRAGEVLDQVPAPGDSLQAGTAIDITVASPRSSS